MALRLTPRPLRIPALSIIGKGIAGGSRLAGAVLMVGQYL